MDVTIIKPYKFSSLGGVAGIDVLEFKVLDNTQVPIKNQRVDLFSQKTNSYLTCFYSDKNGEINLFGIDLKTGPYFVAAHDKTKQFNGVISDHIGGPDYDNNEGQTVTIKRHLY